MRRDQVRSTGWKDGGKRKGKEKERSYRRTREEGMGREGNETEESRGVGKESRMRRESGKEDDMNGLRLLRMSSTLQIS